MRRLVLNRIALDDLMLWAKDNPKILKRIFELFSNMVDTPFTGIGKPEALKGNLQGHWSRRINEEHRIVYSITDETIIVVACRTHYDNL
jgi:toxin YoeB